MEQNKESRSRPTRIWSIAFSVKMPRPLNGERLEFSIQDAGLTGSLRREEEIILTANTKII